MITDNIYNLPSVAQGEYFKRTWFTFPYDITNCDYQAFIVDFSSNILDCFSFEKDLPYVLYPILDEAQTAGLPVGTYLYDIWETDTADANKKTQISRGTMTIREGYSS